MPKTTQIGGHLARRLVAVARVFGHGLGDDAVATAVDCSPRNRQRAGSPGAAAERNPVGVALDEMDMVNRQAQAISGNLAERDLRMSKLQQKISGCFRTPAGTDLFCRIRGYISTLRKQGYEILPALISLWSDTPFIPIPAE